MVLILRFWPGFLATVAVFGITSLPSVEVRNLEGGSLLPKKKKPLKNVIFFLLRF